MFRLIKVKIIDTNQGTDQNKQIVTIVYMKNWKRNQLKPDSVKSLIDIWRQIISDSGQIVVTC